MFNIMVLADFICYNFSALKVSLNGEVKYFEVKPDAREVVINVPGNFKKEDLRTLKTKKALMAAMSKLLALQNFTQITVHGLCEEALISRATFYSHFADKYDLLKYWLTNIKSETKNNINSYEDIEKSINDFTDRNSKVIKNLLEDINSETAELLCDFMLLLLDIYSDEIDGGHKNPKYIILSRFCCGGLMNYSKWQVENRFPEGLQMMNSYLYDLLLGLLKWYAE